MTNTWKEDIFDNLVRLKRGYDLPNQNIITGKFPVVASSSIKDYHNEYKVKPPIIVTGRSGTLGEVQYINEKCWPLNTTLYSVSFRGNFPKYVYYYLKEMHLENFNAGAGVPTLNQNHLQKLRVKIPHFETQKKIAAILSAYDDLIENNKRRIALLENMAEEIYREWFVRFRFPNYKNSEFEKGIPKGWVELPISQILDFKSGFAFKSETYVNDGKYGVVTIKNVHDGKFISDCTDTINDLPSRLPKHCLIKNADILMSLTGNVGRVCLAQGGNLLLNQRVVVIKPKNSQHQSFIYWLFRQKSMMTLCEMISTGTAQQNLSPIKLGNQEIICPANDVLLSFDEKITPITKMTLSLRAQITHLEKMRNQLLPRLISGKLTVENLNIQFPPSMVEAT